MRRFMQWFLPLALLLTVVPALAADGPILVDHTCRDLRQIPQSAIVTAKATLHIAYGHTSHGSQLTDGMSGLVAFANGGGLGLTLPTDIFAWNEGGSGGALDLRDYAMDGDVGYYPAWVNNTRAYLGTPNPTTGRGNAHPDINVVIWSWCGQVSSQTQASMISNYLTPMSTLETDYPGITFVYMTGHLDGSGSAGNLHLRNEQIRAYCRDHGKVLYDFADIESYGPEATTNYLELYGTDGCWYDSDGDENPYGDRNWAVDWQNSHTENVDWYDCSAAHTEALNGNLKAYAAWWLWARLGGWQGGGGSAAPFGSFDTPVGGSTVRSSVAVTGWALDDAGVESVKIYREEGGTLAFVGDGMLIEGARPDVETTYPTLPHASRAGWGYMMLTNFLPHGDGTYRLHAIARDGGGRETDLGTRVITVDNAHATLPFGTIDTPEQGGTASGSSYVNFGWTLTPGAASIPTDGSTIWVWVDGVPLGHPVYNQYREDIATLFPGYANSGGAVGYYYLDPSSLSEGVHTIAWSVQDDQGREDGIGSRYFSVSHDESSRLLGTPRTEEDSSLGIPPTQWAVSHDESFNLNNKEENGLRPLPPPSAPPSWEGGWGERNVPSSGALANLEPGTWNLERGTWNSSPPCGCAAALPGTRRSPCRRRTARSSSTPRWASRYGSVSVPSLRGAGPAGSGCWARPGRCPRVPASTRVPAPFRGSPVPGLPAPSNWSSTGGRSGSPRCADGWRSG